MEIPGTKWKTKLMSLVSAAKEEIARSPVAAISGGVGVLIAGISLILAWIQFQTPSIAGVPIASAARLSLGINVSNLLLLVAYFVAITSTTAIILRAVARKHDLAAFFASIPMLAFTNFSTILVIYLAPPREFKQSTFTSAHDLVFYGAATIVITFCGKAVMRDIISPANKAPKEPSPDEKTESSQVLGGLLLVVIVMAVWGKLVYAGQVRLTETLLPEVTHPIAATLQTAQAQQDAASK